LVPLVMAEIIDKGIAHSDISYIIKMSGVLVCLAIIGFAVSITAQFFSANAAVRTAAAIRKDLFEKIVSLSANTRESIGEEALTARMTSDINQIQSGVNMFLRLFLRSPFVVAGAIVMAFVVDAKSALVFLVVVFILSIIVVVIMNYTLPRYKQIQNKLESVLHATSENLEGARVLRAFCQSDNENEEFQEKTKALYQHQISTGAISGLLNPITYVIVNVGIVALIYVAARRVDGGFILQGSVVALVNYMSQILVELVKLANLIVLLMKAFPSADRVEEIIKLNSDERVHLKQEKRPVGADIEFCNVCFSYNQSDEYDVENISMKVPKGSTLGIIGGTGSGKSTVVKLLNHTYDVSSGVIEIGGIPVQQYSDDELSQLFGIVPQKAALFSGTVRSNMCMKRKNATDLDIEEALSIAQAIDFIREKDGGLDAPVSQRGTNFSGGQRQRLTIARAIVGHPEILVLDDSASALDLATEAKLRKALKSLSWNPTKIIVSQRASSVKDADQILVLDDGKCVGLGSHDELIKSCEVYEEIYYCQYPREEAVE